MFKSTTAKPSTTLPVKTKPTNTPTPSKKSPLANKTPAQTKAQEKPTTKPVVKQVPKPVEEKPARSVKETAKQIETQVMKEKKEKQTEKEVSSGLKTNATKPSIKQPVNDTNYTESKGEKQVVFAWSPPGAGKVQISGSFNDWQEKLDMKPVGDKHELSIPLKPGKYAYKYIVDGEWCYDFTAPNEHDPDGNVNNVITV